MKLLSQYQIIRCVKCGTQNRIISEKSSIAICSICKEKLLSNRTYYDILEIPNLSTSKEIKNDIDNSHLQQCEQYRKKKRDPMIKMLLINTLVYNVIVTVIGVPLIINYLHFDVKPLYVIVGYIIYMIMVMLNGLSKRCPECRKTFALHIYNSQMLDQYTRTKNVTRTDHHYNSKGESVGTTVRQETIPVTITKYLNYYKCKFCGYVQTGISEVES